MEADLLRRRPPCALRCTRTRRGEDPCFGPFLSPSDVYPGSADDSESEIVAKKEVAPTIGERKILQRSLESPFLVGLKFSFQTDQDLYLVTDFKSGGELFWHLQRETRFSEERARFYVAELVLALEHLHKYDIVYR